MGGRQVDVAVIGAGLGGLACGTFLAKQGMRVAVFEHHYRPGGYCHAFRRGPYVFDAAIEYIGCCGKGQDVWNALRLLGADRYIRFEEMDPKGFDRLYFPRHVVDVCRDFREYQSRLEILFPQDRQGIREYFATLARIWQEIHVWGAAMFSWRFGRFPAVCPTLRKYVGKSLSHLLTATIRSPELRAILAGQSGNYALPPSRADLITHAIIIMHFHNGAYYPHGGVQRLSDALVKSLEDHGGELHLRKGIQRILVGRRGVCGVELECGEVVHAKTVVSNADPATTFFGLLHENGTTRRRIPWQKPEYSLSSFQVYLGVRIDLNRIGFGVRNHWLCPSYDFEKVYRVLFNGHLPKQTYALVTAQTLKDTSGTSAPPGAHILKILTPVSIRSFGEWDDTKLGRRGKRYRGLKDHFAASLIEQASQIVPGLQDRIECQVIGSPLTNVAYTRAPEGAMYGPARTPDQSGPTHLSPVTHVPGLYLTGTSVYYPGVLGAVGSGIMTGVLILRQKDTRTRAVVMDRIVASQKDQRI